ncbi:hypothetical protein EGW08_005381 [Elysia chlorotica]|uniref:Transglutaminase-like domain-containing protein n=1 Tax=Elysia chlorotica TaxID=188477 RepID=A0A3S1BF43_ELYCH|nr:hypothetical protein EGW08_005381 [Elysia chlorotica]
MKLLRVEIKSSLRSLRSRFAKMYRRMYGLPKYQGKAFSVFPTKPKRSSESRIVENSLKDASGTQGQPLSYCFRPRRWPRPSERDSSVWEGLLAPESLDKLRELRAQREKPAPPSLDDSNLASVKAECLLVEDLDLHVRENAEEHHTDLFECTDRDQDPQLVDECLLVEDLDLHVRENAEEHHTDLFECTDRDQDPQLVVRRGQEFKLTLTFQRPWNSELDDMHLVFWIGGEPNPQKGTYVDMKLEEGKDIGYMDDLAYRALQSSDTLFFNIISNTTTTSLLPQTNHPREWGARILSQSENSLTVGVYSPPDVIVGEWEYAVRTIKVKDGKDENYECEGSEEVIILLNPWCQDDQVYMEDTDYLKEYILNQVGLVFCGSYHSIQSKPWSYDQFLEGILDASLHLLRKANDFEVSASMGDPVYIARALSRIMNNLGDCGVLEGRWDGEYSDGTRPVSWMGSAPILTEYMEKGQPVKYGQCWVFPGWAAPPSSLSTWRRASPLMARALGLPCRSVTNFSSAHDTDLTMTIDRYVDDNGDEVENKNNDSVWNFHVWNDVWMLRPDLDRLTGKKGKYDGWHAVDATPQELTVFQCGPSPLAAIKEGDVHIGYDTKFIFAEVNAEYCNWKDGSPPVLISSNSNRVGRKISTKLPTGGFVGYYNGIDEGVRQDLTDQYKNPEGSMTERVIVKKATRKGKLGNYLFKNNTDVQISFDELDERPRVGQDVTLKVSARNTGSETRSVSLRITVRPINYWGAFRGKDVIATKLFDKEPLEAGQTRSFELTVGADDILRLCDESLSMKVMALCSVQGFKEPLFHSDELAIKTPGIRCSGPSGSVDAGETVDLEMTLKNPLSKQALTGCKLKIQGTVLVDDDRFTHKHARYTADLDDLQPGEVRTVSVKIRPTLLPKNSQEREVNVGLETRELPDFVGNLHIDLNI